MGYLAGLDVGGTKCAAVLGRARYDGDGTLAAIDLLDRAVMPTDTARGVEDTLERLFALLRTLLERHPGAAGDLDAVGASCGGPLDAAAGVVLSPPNLPGWDRIPLVQRISAAFGVPAFLQNDANAGALVEWKLGAGRGAKNMVFLTMGTGMGAGVIAAGKLLDGAAGLAGEVGHIRLARRGPVGFGKAGSFEGFCGGSGIARLARDLTLQWTDIGRPPAWTRDGHAAEALSVRLLAGYADAGDPRALEVFTQVGSRLGEGLSYLMDILNPERIVIGSIFVRCEKYLRPAMETAIRREALDPARTSCRVVPAQTGEAIGDLAALLVALHGLEHADPPAPRPSEPAAPATACASVGVAPTGPAAPVPPRAAPPERARQLLADIFEDLFARYPALAPIRPDLRAAYELLEATFSRGGRLLIAGNGGSAADAEHVVGEMMKGFMLPRRLPPDEAAALDRAFAGLVPDASAKFQRALPAICLSNHPALSTAYANDIDPDFVFAQQVLGYGRPGDLFWGISTSGNAKNVAYAALTAKARGLSTLGMTGPGGGRLAGLCDVCLRAPGDCTPDIQELHLPVYHALCRMVEARFFAE